MLFRLRALVRRSHGHAHPVLRIGELAFDTHTGSVTLAGRPVSLTAQESRLLAYLAHHFRITATEAFDERLTALLNVVIAGLAWDPAAQRLVHERPLGDLRFEQALSGWYWQISDGSERVLTSRSLWDQRLPVRSHRQVMIRDLAGPRGTPLRVIERDICLAPLDGPLHVSVAVSRETLDAELARFSRLITLFLIGLGLLLLATLAL